jgi:hypothetical protein
VLSKWDSPLYLDMLALLRHYIMPWKIRHQYFIKYTKKMILESTRFGRVFTKLVVLLTYLKLTFASEDTARPMRYARYVLNTSHPVLILPSSSMARSNMCRPREEMISSHRTYHGFNKPHHPRAKQDHHHRHSLTRHPQTQEPCLPTLPLTSPPSRSWL